MKRKEENSGFGREIECTQNRTWCGLPDARTTGNEITWWSTGSRESISR
jgi:hypothetical protein